RLAIGGDAQIGGGGGERDAQRPDERRQPIVAHGRDRPGGGGHGEAERAVAGVERRQRVGARDRQARLGAVGEVDERPLARGGELYCLIQVGGDDGSLGEQEEVDGIFLEPMVVAGGEQAAPQRHQRDDGVAQRVAGVLGGAAVGQAQGVARGGVEGVERGAAGGVALAPVAAVGGQLVLGVLAGDQAPD